METIIGNQGQARLFIAIRAPGEIFTPAEAFREANKGLPGTRWLPLNNLHITVFFLGDIALAHVPKILEVMERGIEVAGDFELDFKCFSLEGGRRVSMVWARFHQHPSFSALAEWMRTELAGYCSEPVRFIDPIPHITLARIRSGPPPAINHSLPLPPLSFNGYELWRTLRQPGGVHYEVIGDCYK